MEGKSRIVTPEEKAKILLEAEMRFGRQLQMIKAVEELSELTQVICKILNKPTKERFDNFFLEIADVEIMLEQVKTFYDCQKEVEVAKNSQLIRLEKLLLDLRKEK